MSIERRIVTILFADLVDFTPLSERLDAEDVATVQDAYFEVVRDTVGRYGGTLEKFIGDAVMAAFGLGRARDDDAERAVRAGLAMIHGVESLGARLGLEVDALRIRVGVNTGEAVVSAAVPSEGQGTDLGRVTGDTVNVAARLQAASTPGRVLVGGATALAVEGAIELESAVEIALKGKAEPVHAHLVVGVRPEPSRDLAMAGMVAPTVGRSAEVDRLLEALARARDGAAARALIVAPPGVGKSRLLGEFAVRVDDDRLPGVPAAVWRTRSRQGAGLPFALVRDVVFSAIAAAGLDEIGVTGSNGGRGRLHALVEALGLSGERAAVVVEMTTRLLVPAAPVESEGHEATTATADRSELFAALSTVLRASTGDRSVVWLTEDLHWASPDEIAFIEALTGDPAWDRLLIVATARPSVTGQLDAEWIMVDLAPLPAADAGSLVRALVGDAVPPDLLERIVDRSDGNPLFIEELLRTWVSLGTLTRSGGDGPWQLTAPATDVPLPTTIQAIYASQLDDLPEAARTVARRAAVAGRRFPTDALPDLGTTDPDIAVAELARRAVVNGPLADRLLGDTYGYRHALVRDAGYASLARAERADLHVRLARWLEGAAGDAADVMAGAIGGQYADALTNSSALTTTIGAGLDRAAVAALAASWLERAGDVAMAASALDAARDAFERAVAMTASDEPLAMGRRLTRLGDSFTGSGGLDLAIDAYERAVTAFETALEGDTLARGDGQTARRGLATAARALGLARFEQTRYDETLAIARRAIERVAEDERARLGLDLLVVEATLALSNEAVPLIPVMSGLRERADATGDADLILEAMHTEVRVLSEAGTATSDAFETLAGRFEERGRSRLAASALINGAKLATEDEARFERLAARADILADAHGLAESQVWIAMLRALRDLVLGEWQRATDVALSGIAIGEANGYHRAVVRSWFVLGPIAAARGDRPTLERAATWFAARDSENTFPDSPYGRLMHEGIVIDLASAGLRVAPRPELDRFSAAFALPYDSADWLIAIERVIRAMLDAGRVDDARQAIDLVPRPAVGRDPMTWVSDSLVRAWVADASGDRDAAVAFARAGLAADAARKAPWWTHRLLRVVHGDGAPIPGALEHGEMTARLGLAAAATD
ncbi:MAG: adenylate/guanylate cyclase domain-containing protein [Chloroflexota bacterium]